MNPLITVMLKQYEPEGQTQILELPDVLVDTGATQSYINEDCIPPVMKMRFKIIFANAKFRPA